MTKFNEENTPGRPGGCLSEGLRLLREWGPVLPTLSPPHPHPLMDTGFAGREMAEIPPKVLLPSVIRLGSPLALILQECFPWRGGGPGPPISYGGRTGLAG